MRDRVPYGIAELPRPVLASLTEKVEDVELVALIGCESSAREFGMVFSEDLL